LTARKPVQAEQQDRHAPAQRPRQRLLEPLGEQQPVGQPRERIVQRLVDDPLVQPPPLGQVGHADQQPVAERLVVGADEHHVARRPRDRDLDVARRLAVAHRADPGGLLRAGLHLPAVVVAQLEPLPPARVRDQLLALHPEERARGRVGLEDPPGLVDRQQARLERREHRPQPLLAHPQLGVRVLEVVDDPGVLARQRVGLDVVRVVDGAQLNRSS
jgi:hypothetical protein